MPTSPLSASGVIALLLMASILLILLGLILRRNGKLVSRGAWLIWTIISLIPLFIGGPLLFLRSQNRTIASPPSPGLDQLGNATGDGNQSLRP